MHDVLVGYVAVGKDDLLHAFAANQIGNVGLVIDGYALRIARAGQFGRIDAPRDVGNLGGSERDYLVRWVVTEVDVKVVKVAPRCAHDDHFVGVHNSFLYDSSQPICVAVLRFSPRLAK